MVAHRSRHIDIGVRMMQCVEAPQERHRMLTAMYGVDQKIEQQESCQNAQPLIGDWPGGQTHAKYRLEFRPEGVPRREREGGKHDIEHPDAEIAEPPPQCRELPLPPRPAEFP